MTTLNQEQDGLVSTLEDVANMLQRTQTNLKKCPKTRLTEGYVKARLKCIEEYWSTFKQTHSSLIKCTPREQRAFMSYFNNEEFYKYEEIFLSMQAELTDMVLKSEQSKTQDTYQSFQSDGSQVQSQSQSLARLPRIQLPNFSGKYEDWPTYQDLFIALVHNNNSLCDVQKLHYLKTSVSGEAELLIRHVQITASNYLQAWETLKARFGNKKALVTNILKRLFSQKKLHAQSASQIKSILDITTECLNSLNNLQINTDSWDPIIVFLVSQKLDPESFKDWEKRTHKETSEEMPSWNELKVFLEAQFRTLESINPVPMREKTQPSRSYHITATTTSDNEDEDNIVQSAHTKVKPQTNQSCSYCNADHYIHYCKEFAKRPVNERREYVQKQRLCFNCLVPGHSVYQCRHRTTCRICRRRHHSLLHEANKQPEKFDNNTKQTNTGDQTIQQKPEHVTTHFAQQEQPGQQVLLATALVNIIGRNGDSHTVRALVDQGSEASFISAGVVDLLGLKKIQVNGSVSGVGDDHSTPISHKVGLLITPRFNHNDALEVNAYVLKSVSKGVPSRQIKVNWSELQQYKLADPTCNTPGKVHILLGADVFGSIIEAGLIKMNDGIVAQNTKLGWVLSGQRRDYKDTDQHKHVIALHITNMVEEDNDMLRRFWEIETNTYKKKKILTKEEIECERIYTKTTKRDKQTGKYEVQLPLKQSKEETIKLCGRTKEQAIKRLINLERKFERNPNLKEEYTNVIKEYLKMGHMKKSADEDDLTAIYLPHHAVVRNDKDTTKVRVVFDASAKGSNGHALNESMMIGPVIQSDLRSLIIKWRRHRICVVGDIVKMYRMVHMTPKHTNLQRILWRDGPQEQIQSYDLTTVTFGTAAAPYLAVRTLHQLADDETEEYPTAAELIKQSFYVDDFMAGNEDIETTKNMCKEVNDVLKRGGFNMQKWSSNSEDILHYLQKEGNTRDKLEIKIDKVIKILGLKWDRQDDKFKITVNKIDLQYPVTKRSVISEIARLFDPFGWLSPVVISAKIMIQRLWLSKLGWDDELPQELLEDWIEYRDDLTHLKDVSINRWLRTSSRVKDVQLHGFSDASSKAYAAVTYLKVIDNDDQVHITMIAARTKVAPLKQLSIPRLELCAAALLAELVNDVSDLLNVPKNKVFAWSDSMVVLAWLQSQPSRWRTFVANRVSEVTRIIDSDRWRHVQSSDNPADIATRGVKATDLSSHDMWWTGPQWLKSKVEVFKVDDIPETLLEIKEDQRVFHTRINDDEKAIWERFSNILRMKRVLAYCRRLLKGEKEKENITIEEMEKVINACIRYYQNLVYEDEIKDLRKNKGVKKGSSLITLTPFLDDNDLMRVGGRLANANIPETLKHPIIIPNGQHITRLIIEDAHKKTLHGGIQLMMNYVRTNYWVIGLKAAIKKSIRSCKVCTVDKALVKTQLMGQLPAVRVNPSRAFINSGVDFAGPVLMRTSKGRGHQATKGYICLFVCMSTRAIHLEAVTDLTSEAFIAAFRRFVARRGRCAHLWSDNGTNFVGAARELKCLLDNSNNNMANEVASILANEGTTWHFIPPRMPNCGGLWEAGIRSAKRHLARINKETKLTYEEMSTLLAQVEACLNSRPLCQIDNFTETPLTPGHFLVGEPLIGVPDLNYEDKKINLLSRWQFIQRLTKDFWRKWQAEYLHTLQQKYKWQVTVPSPAIGDVVIIKETELPPTKWLLGRIEKLYPGSDNLSRVATVRCKGNHELRRPISKLILLPKNCENE